MNHSPLWLAESPAADLAHATGGLAATPLFQWAVLSGALVLIILVAGFIAVLFSGKKKSRSHRHGRHRPAAESSSAETAAVPAAEEEPRRKRKRRREHRPLNPTLAQTGGLPPIRDENTPLPPMP